MSDRENTSSKNNQEDSRFAKARAWAQAHNQQRQLVSAEEVSKRFSRDDGELCKRFNLNKPQGG